MKSFRLDTNSVNDAIESWPAILTALLISAFLMYVGWFHAAWRGILIAFGALYFGYVFRGALTRDLRSKYPNATSLWLISIGFTSALFGLAIRVLMPSLQGSFSDYLWIILSFTTILAFVVINRRDPDVLK
jgi:hypothetical protein